MKKYPKIIVHGGAWNIPEEFWEDHLNGVESAVSHVFPKLKKGLGALDAVEQAVNILEKDPTFDAGKGAFLNEVGEVELDAIIMDGSNLDFGAVAAIQNILHPVSVARKVMKKTEHSILVGNGALDFAKKMGFKELTPDELLTPRELVFFQKIKSDPSFKTHQPFTEELPSDTVGAVAMDENGNFAVATSTGGTARKLRGRVGDSPIIGSGAYADNWSGGVSTTGWGESIMKVVLAKTVCDLFNSKTSKAAAEEGINILKTRVNGLGGLIGINKNGDYAYAHNTPRMAMAYAEENGNIFKSI